MPPDGIDFGVRGQAGVINNLGGGSLSAHYRANSPCESTIYPQVRLEPLAADHAAALEAASAVPFTLAREGPRRPQVWLTGFGDSSLNFDLVVWLTAEATKRPSAVKAAYKELKPIWNGLAVLTNRPIALSILGGFGLLWLASGFVARDLQVGELHAGVPALKPDSRYNLDSDFISNNYAIGVDILQVYAATKTNGCIDYDVMNRINRFGWYMQNTPGVVSTTSLAGLDKVVWGQYNENNPRWQQLPRSPDGLILAGQQFTTSTGLLNDDCSVMPMYIFTADHKATTIDQVIESIERFDTDGRAPADLKLELAGGNVGVMAATNDVIKKTEFLAYNTPIKADGIIAIKIRDDDELVVRAPEPSPVRTERRRGQPEQLDWFDMV